MHLTQDFIPAGRRNRPGRVNPIRLITIHNTGNTNKGANARAHANYLKGDTAAGIPVSWHYTVDERDIFQHLPDNEDAFHAGDGAGNGNRQSIGIEICMNSDGDLRGATDKAAELAAHLCTEYSIPVTNIVQHNRWNSNKSCPQMLRSNRPYNWDAFINKIRSFLTATPVPAPAQPELLPLDAIAREVIRGLWGNGQERVARLTAAGYDARAVQARVNQLLR